MTFEDVAAGQELHCHCEALINYEEMKGASLCSFDKCGVDTSTHLPLGKIGRFQSVQ
jgi:hypothetical protein